MNVVVSKLFSPYSLSLLYIAVFFSIFIETPLGWHSELGIDNRYNHVLYIYIILFTITYFLASSIFKFDKKVRGFAGAENVYNQIIFEKRLFLILLICAFFSILTFYKLGAIPIFAENKHDLRGVKTLGGVVDYQVDLLTMISVIYIYLYKIKNKKFYLSLSLLALFFPVLMQNRQEVVIYIVMFIFIMYGDKKIKFSYIVIMLITVFILIYGLGYWFLLRRGIENVYSGGFNYLLPIWIFLGDFNGGIMLGYKVVDAAGPGGLNFLYTVPVYLSVVLPNIENIVGDHGAILIQNEFTSANTAQSIGIPMSYYADGGMIYVILLAIANSSILFFFKRQSHNSAKKIQFNILYGMTFIWSVWIIRSGSIAFGPILIYQALVLFAVVRSNLSKYFFILYLVIVSITLVVGIVRL